MQRLAFLAVLVAFLAPALASAEDRPFVLTERSNGPSDAGEVSGIYAMNVGASTNGALRIVANTVGHAGVVYQLGAQVSATDWLAVGAFGLVGMGYEADAGNGASGGGYVHVTLLRPGRDQHDGASLAVQVWAVKEFGAFFSVSGWLNGSYRLGGLDVGANVQIEHRFVLPGGDPSDADALDVLVRLAATYAVAGDDLRLGVEYVGQDLEDLGSSRVEAEGGHVHLFALSATSSPDDRRALSIGAAPGIVVAPRTGQVGFGGRLTVAYRF